MEKSLPGESKNQSLKRLRKARTDLNDNIKHLQEEKSEEKHEQTMKRQRELKVITEIAAGNIEMDTEDIENEEQCLAQMEQNKAKSKVLQQKLKKIQKVYKQEDQTKQTFECDKCN